MSEWVASVLACPSCPAALDARARFLSNLEGLWYVALPFVISILIARALVKRMEARDDE